MTKKTLWLIGLGLVIVFLIVGIVLWQRPTRVVTRAVENLGKAQTQRFHTTIALTNPQATEQFLGSQGTVEIKLNGAFARETEGRPALVSDVIVSAKTESITVQLEGELRFIEDQAYVFVKTAPPTIPVLAQLKGKWLTFPRGGAVAGETTAPEGPLFVEVKRAGRETIEGVSTTKYSAQATTAAVIEMMDGIAQLLGTQLTNDQIANLRNNLTQAENVPVELWATPWKNELKQLRVALDTPGGNAIQYTITFLDPNKQLEIAAPEGAVSIEQALQPPVQ